MPVFGFSTHKTWIFSQLFSSVFTMAQRRVLPSQAKMPLALSQKMRVFMSNMTVTETIASYPYIAAGRTWLIANVNLKKAPDGTVVIPGFEIERMHRIIVNEICGSPSPLTPAELEFLCDTTTTRFNEVAEFLAVTKGSVTFWKRPGKFVPLGESLRLKRWFWYKVFAEDLAVSPQTIGLEIVADDARLLETLKERGKSFAEMKKAS
jgi:hypothetical protein